MIIARFQVEDSAAGRHLVGVTTSSWPLAIGTRLVLRRRGDEYELIELGERRCRLPSDAAVMSFVNPDDGG